MLPSMMVMSRECKLVRNHHPRGFAQNWLDPDSMVNVDVTEPVQTGLNASVWTGLLSGKKLEASNRCKGIGRKSEAEIHPRLQDIHL